MDNSPLSQKTESLFQFVRLHGWCDQTESMIAGMKELFDSLDPAGKKKLLNLVRVRLEGGASLEEILAALVIIWKAEENPKEMMKLIYWRLAGKLSSQNYQYLVRNFFTVVLPLSNDISFDLIQRKFISYRRAILYALDIKYLDSKLNPEYTLLFFICLLCRKDLNEQNRAIVYYLLSRIDADMPSKIYSDILGYIKKLQDVIDDVQEKREKVLTEELLMQNEPDFRERPGENRKDPNNPAGRMLSGYDRERVFEKTDHLPVRKRSYARSEPVAEKRHPNSSDKTRGERYDFSRSSGVKSSAGKVFSSITSSFRKAGSGLLKGLGKLAEGATAFIRSYAAGERGRKATADRSSELQQYAADKEEQPQTGESGHSVYEGKNDSGIRTVEKERSRLYRISFNRTPKDIAKLLDMYPGSEDGSGRKRFSAFRRLKIPKIPRKLLWFAVPAALLFLAVILVFPIRNRQNPEPISVKQTEVHEPSGRDSPGLQEMNHHKTSGEDVEAHGNENGSNELLRSRKASETSAKPVSEDPGKIDSGTEGVSDNSGPESGSRSPVRNINAGPDMLVNPVFKRVGNSLYWVPSKGNSISALYMYFIADPAADAAVKRLLPLESWDMFLSWILEHNPGISNPHIILNGVPLEIYEYGDANGE